MHMIISPTKRMREDDDWLAPCDAPCFLKEASRVYTWLRERSYDEMKAIWACNDGIARAAYERLHALDLADARTPAILAFDGIQFQYMAPSVFEDASLAYVSRHLSILSGLYGILRPLDAVIPYRLEMQASAPVCGARSPLAFWGDRLAAEVLRRAGGATIVNLASKEYARGVARSAAVRDATVTCTFGELAGGRVVQKGVHVKMARGEMVRFAAETGARRVEDLRAFDRLGYRYSEELSTPHEYVFLHAPGE